MVTLSTKTTKTTKTTFAKFFKEAIVEAVAKDNSLGNRSKYIGASDIAGCLRKSYLDKVDPKEISSKQAIIFQRGHISEELIKLGLDIKKIPYKYQEEISDGFIKAHLDFLFTKKDEMIVVEVKSSTNIPENIYESWMLQIQLQMHLVQKKHSKYTRGYIVCINSGTGEVKDFEVFYNESLAQIALDKAEELWKSLKHKKAPEAEEQLYCSKCPHREDCPIFKKGAEEVNDMLKKELLAQISKIKEIEEEEKALKAKKQALKDELEEYMRAVEINKIDLGDRVLSLTKDTESVSLDTTALKKSDPELFEKLVEKYQKVSKRKGYIRIK